MLDSNAQSLASAIEREYRSRGYALGWRFLYSPAQVLRGARVAFVGLNPGGATKPADHAEFSMDRGSAYELEAWGSPPGQSKLQRQVRALFELVGEEPKNVLAGNLVPFRSPSWAELPQSTVAVNFGKTLWTQVLREAKPSLLIAMGSETTKAMAEVMNVKKQERVPVGWGSVAAVRGLSSSGILVGLPHLSRFGIVTRSESAAALSYLFRQG